MEMNKNNNKRDDEIRNELLPRTDKYKELIGNQKVPKTTESKIIIPCLTKTFGFRTNEFDKNEAVIENAIEKRSFNAFVRKANEIIEEEMIIKSKKQNEPFFILIQYLLKISIGVAMLGMLLLASAVYVDYEASVGHIITIVSSCLLGISTTMAALCPIFLYRAKYETHNYEQRIKERLNSLLIEQNRNNWRSGKKHLMWAVQKNFFWLELHIDRIMLSLNRRISFKNNDQTLEYQHNA